ncbi:hypothetical protein Vafri_13402 [Volvox africanus]|nr:hypothetical protein Vafri_13402 [Volvox africanus]
MTVCVVRRDDDRDLGIQHLMPLRGIVRTQEQVTGMIWDCMDGGSLHYAIQTDVDLATLLSVLADGAMGCHLLHNSGVVHRDVKPDNILMDRSGDAVHGRLADYDLAVEAGIESGMVGTPGFNPPEGSGKVPSRHGRAFDFYSFGASLGCVLLRVGDPTQLLMSLHDTRTAAPTVMADLVSMAKNEHPSAPAGFDYLRLFELVHNATNRVELNRLVWKPSGQQRPVRGTLADFAQRLREMAAVAKR